MSSNFKEEVAFMGVAIRWWILIGILVTATTFAGLYLRPYFLGLERSAFTASHQYIEARRTKLTTMTEQWHAITVEIVRADRDNNLALKDSLTAQRNALLAQIRQAAFQIPDKDIPSTTRTILRR